MLDPRNPITELRKHDPRYAFEAYVFVFESLNYGQEVLGMGQEGRSEPVPAELSGPETDKDEPPERHVSGQQLCEAARHYALDQYGYLAKTVLNTWGVKCTGDIGEIVFNLIRAKQMRKTAHDRREDFNDVYDFDKAFREEFKFTLPP